MNQMKKSELNNHSRMVIKRNKKKLILLNLEVDHLFKSEERVKEKEKRE